MQFLDTDQISSAFIAYETYSTYSLRTPSAISGELLRLILILYQRSERHLPLSVLASMAPPNMVSLSLKAFRVSMMFASLLFYYMRALNINDFAECGFTFSMISDYL